MHLTRCYKTASVLDILNNAVRVQRSMQARYVGGLRAGNGRLVHSFQKLLDMYRQADCAFKFGKGYITKACQCVPMCECECVCACLKCMNVRI